MAHNFTLRLFLVQILIVFQMCEAEVPAVIVFGDSSVDTGNNNFIPTIAKCNFKPYGRDFPGGSATGRFCNGRLPPDFISEAYGLPPTLPAYLDPMYSISDFSTGVCFASAATGYDNVTADLLKVIPLWKQVEYYKEYQEKLRSYLGEERANEIVREALYLISIGTNDFLENYYTLPGRRRDFTIGQYQDFLIGLATDFLGQLYALGARKISLTGVPPMGCLPTERATNFKDPGNCVKKYNDIGLEFNRKLEALATKMNNQFNGLKIVNADANPILSQLIAEPSRYGFEVAEVGCCGTGTIEMGILCNQHNPFTCPDADKYVFWDAIHPSQRTNQIISDYLLTSLKANFK